MKRGGKKYFVDTAGKNIHSAGGLLLFLNPIAIIFVTNDDDEPNEYCFAEAGQYLPG